MVLTLARTSEICIGDQCQQQAQEGKRHGEVGWRHASTAYLGWDSLSRDFSHCGSVPVFLSTSVW